VKFQKLLRKAPVSVADQICLTSSRLHGYRGKHHPLSQVAHQFLAGVPLYQSALECAGVCHRATPSPRASLRRFRLARAGIFGYSELPVLEKFFLLRIESWDTLCSPRNISLSSSFAVEVALASHTTETSLPRPWVVRERSDAMHPAPSIF
jgi:hypothetical protein